MEKEIDQQNSEIEENISEEQNSDDSSSEDNSSAERNYEEEINLLKDQLLRSVAENQNQRSRFEKQIKDERDYAKSDFAKDIINVKDNLKRTMQVLDNEDMKENPLLKAFREGIEMTMKDIDKIFERHNIKEINPNKGEDFDHNFHQAVAHIEHDEIKSGIIDIMQTGYVLKDRLLRPAMVSVAKTA